MENKKIKEKTQLVNGCFVSNLAVHPANWDEKGASVAQDWYISFRYYDTRLKNIPGVRWKQQFIVKGMNEFKSLSSRRMATKAILINEKEKMVLQHFNPIRKIFMIPEHLPNFKFQVSPQTPFADALKMAFDKKSCEPTTKIDLKSVLKYTIEAIKQLQYESIPIEQVRRLHMMCIFAQLEIIKGDKWTANNHNHYRSHLSMLFETLIEWCTIDINPVEKIAVKKTLIKKRKVLTEQQRKMIDADLRANDYRFWIYMNIFFLTGCRRTESMLIKGKDVDLNKQEVSVIRKKGKQHTEVFYTIPDNAVHFWEIALKNCEPEDYVFSVGLKPGKSNILPSQITKRWKRKVKNVKDENGKPKYGEDVPDFYSLKHLQTTEIAKKYGTKVAADFNNESVEMIIKHYDVEHEERERAKKKKIVKIFA